VKRFKDSRKGVSTTTIVGAIILIVIIIVAALYALELPPFTRPPFEGIIIHPLNVAP